MKIILISLLMLLPLLTFAEGGKNQKKNPVFDEDCVTQFPQNLDKDKCEEIPASSVSGVKVFFCDTEVIAVCND